MAEFELYQDAAGEYRWRLQADNHEIIADSGEGYVAKRDCEHGIELVKDLAPGAAINDLTRQGPREASDGVNGEVVNRVTFGTEGIVEGTLRQVDATTWVEVNSSRGPKPDAWQEVERDDSSVTLHDATRDMSMRIDLLAGQLMAWAGSEPPAPLGEVVDALVDGDPPRLDEVGGPAMRRVAFGYGTQVVGRLFQVGRSTWVEESVTAGRRFEFTERGRDDWSVYLRDAARDLFLQVDLHTRRVTARVGTSRKLPFYDVILASDVTTGQLVNRVEMGWNGQAIGALRQTAPTTWAEDSAADGPDRFHFTESGRDEWSVYLHDASRNVSLQVDLHTRQVMYAGGSPAPIPLYDVISATDVVNGWTVTRVEVGEGGQAVGVLRQIRPRRWIERTADGDRSDFIEIGRDDWSVYLRDRRGDASVQIDLHTRLVTRTAGSAGRTSRNDIIGATGFR